MTIKVTGPVLIFLKIEMASPCDIPCTDIPLTDNISSPEQKIAFYDPMIGFQFECILQVTGFQDQNTQSSMLDTALLACCCLC